MVFFCFKMGCIEALTHGTVLENFELSLAQAKHRVAVLNKFTIVI